MAQTTSKTHEEDEEEEEVEPLLKYSRLGNDLKRVLKEDPASCLAVHEKFLALGSHQGAVHIFDHEGNRCVDKKMKSHDITVNQISIDRAGEFLASCADDGKTVIHDIYSSEHEQLISFDRPVKAVALDPLFARQAKQFVTGDDKLILSERTHGFFGSSIKRTVLHQGEGMVKTIKWNESFISWANDEGVKIYDMHSKQRITYIPFSNKAEARKRPDLYKCHLCWKDESTLLISWGNQVKICEIMSRDSKDVRDLPTKYVKITAMFQTEYFIAGIAPFPEGRIVLLTYNESEVKMEGKFASNPRPHVRLVEPGMNFFNEKSNDALGIREYERYRCDLYGLEWVPGEVTFFIVSPADVIVAKPRTEDDHVTWLVNHKKFEEAMTVVQKSKGKLKHDQHTYSAIGHMYLNYLCDNGDYEGAAARSVKILEGDKEAWENHFFKFQHSGKAKIIAKYLPTENPKLIPAVYELVLYEFLNTDIPLFLEFLERWDNSLYDSQTVVNAVLTFSKSDPNISKEDKRIIYECLAVLYTNQLKFSEALTVYLRLKHKEVFSFIRQHNLFSSIDDKIMLLMDFDLDKALELLINNIQVIKPTKVVQQLNNNLLYQFRYLDLLSTKYPYECRFYHTKMVCLYAEYEPSKLLPFLKREDGYDLHAALRLCAEHDFIAEKVYLLGKMGNHREALRLIITELKSVDYAIDFCKEHNFGPLWNELITYSLDKPEFIKGLLNTIGTHVDPLVLINRIDEKIQIPGLRDSLVKILHDYNLQMSLREDCQKILTTDVYNLLGQHIKLQKRGFCVSDLCDYKSSMHRQEILFKHQRVSREIDAKTNSSVLIPYLETNSVASTA